MAEHDLDETVFHESAHIALAPLLSSDPDWYSNQIADSNFITQYAGEKPDKEDIAESALFAWTMLHHPGRLEILTIDHHFINNQVARPLQFVKNAMLTTHFG